MIRNLVLCLALSFLAFAQMGQAPIIADPPKDIPIPNIIQRFAAKESEFKQALEQYEYVREVIVSASCGGGQPGVYHLIVDVGFDRKGKRVDNVISANSTAQCIEVTKEDLDAFRNQSLFALTTDKIQNYQINFVGQQQESDSHFYLFDVTPTTVLTGEQYFEGRIWVDAHDFLIVKTHGTIATKREKKGKAQENLIPPVMIWRAQIDGRYWFPIQSRTKDVLHFSRGDVEIDELVKLTNFKAVRHPN